MTSGERLEIPAMDGFRAIAALAVVLYHVSYGAGRPPLDDGVIRNVLLSGYMGVDFFFVISGFLLFLPTVVSGGRFGNVRSYAVRRAARILPAYYVVLIAVVALHSLFIDSPVDLPYNSPSGALSFLFHLTFLQHTVGVLLGFPGGFMVHGAVWTLALEAGFYVVLPFVAERYFRRPFAGLVVALAVSLAWRAGAVNFPSAISWLPGGEDLGTLRIILLTQFPAYAVQFAAGMTAAWIFVKLRRAHVGRLAWITLPVQVAAVATIVLAMNAAGKGDLTGSAGTYDHFTGTTIVALAFAVLVLATVLAPRWAQLPVTNPVARRLGDISYGIYLWHLLFIGFALYTLHFAPDATLWAFVRLLAFVVAGSVVTGTLSFLLIERPAIRWARRKSKELESASRQDGATGADVVVPDPAVALRPEPAP
jgi:peptidoglycan/LPS O-acetylase OafA/YrhL